MAHRASSGVGVCFGHSQLLSQSAIDLRCRHADRRHIQRKALWRAACIAASEVREHHAASPLLLAGCSGPTGRWRGVQRYVWQRAARHCRTSMKPHVAPALQHPPNGRAPRGSWGRGQRAAADSPSVSLVLSLHDASGSMRCRRKASERLCHRSTSRRVRTRGCTSLFAPSHPPPHPTPSFLCFASLLITLRASAGL